MRIACVLAEGFEDSEFKKPYDAFRDAGHEVIVIGNNAPEFASALERCRPDQLVIDLVRVPVNFASLRAKYDGICW